MKIVHINSLYFPFQIGGAEKSVQVLAEAQHALGHDVSVLTTAPDDNERQASINGVDVHYLSVRNLYRPFTDKPHASISKALWHSLDSYNPMMGEVIGKKLALLKPDVAHTHTIAGLSVSAWRAAEKRSIPRIHTLRDYYLACPRSTMFRNGHNCTTLCGSCALYAGLRRRQSARVDAVIGNSRFILDRHLDLGYFPNARVKEVIFSGQPAPAGKPSTMRFPGGRPVFGYIGQINPTKGVAMLVETFRQLGPIAELRIAGRIDSDFALGLKAGAPDWVQWLGWQNPADLYQQVDAVIIPSLWHEPLPRAAIEAAMYGAYVIGSNRGGTPEILSLVGGQIFDPEQPASLKAMVQQFIETFADHRRPDITSWAEAFEPDQRARDHLKLYQHLIV